MYSCTAPAMPAPEEPCGLQPARRAPPAHHKLTVPPLTQLRRLLQLVLNLCIGGALQVRAGKQSGKLLRLPAPVRLHRGRAREGVVQQLAVWSVGGGGCSCCSGNACMHSSAWS